MSLATDKAARETAYLRLCDLRGDLRLLCEARNLYLEVQRFSVPEHAYANQLAERLFVKLILPLQEELANTILRSLGVDYSLFVPRAKPASTPEPASCPTCSGRGEVEEGTGYASNEGGELSRMVPCPECVTAPPALAPCAECKRLRALIDRDRSGLGKGLSEILSAVSNWWGSDDGRGPYEWDDARYRAEMASVFRQVKQIAIKTLAASGQRADAAFRPTSSKTNQKPEPGHMVAGERYEGTLNDFRRQADTLLTIEQEKLLPDNALIAFIADAVRISREYERRASNLLHRETQTEEPTL